MPSIEEYNAPSTKLDTEGLTQAARRQSAYATQEANSKAQQGKEFDANLTQGIKDVGEAAVQHVDYWDRTKVANASTDALAQLDQKWQATLKGVPDPDHPGKFLVQPADPFDPDVAKRFSEDQVQPMMDEIKKIPIGVRGGEYAQNKADEIQAHLEGKFRTDMAQQAGDAIVIGRLRTVNNLSTSVAADPSFRNVDFVLKQSDDDMASHSGAATLTADKLAQLKVHGEQDNEALVHTAVVSAVDNARDPDAVVQGFMKRYPQYIKPAEAIQFARAAKAQNKFNASLDRSEVTQKREMQKLDFDQKASGLQSSLVNDDGTHKVAGPGFFQDWKQLAKQPGADPAKLRSLFEFGEKHDGTDHTFDNPDVVQKLNVGSLDGSVSDLDYLKAYNAGDISDKTYTHGVESLKMLNDMGIKDEGFKAAMKAVSSELTASVPGMPWKDPKGVAAYSNFLNDFTKQYQDLMKKKAVPANALDMNDQNSLISQTMAKYDRSPDQKFTDMIVGFSGNAGPTTSKKLPPDPGFLKAQHAGTLHPNVSNPDIVRDSVTGSTFLLSTGQPWKPATTGASGDQ